jgi:hypothetical protein
VLKMLFSWHKNAQKSASADFQQIKLLLKAIKLLIHAKSQSRREGKSLRLCVFA